MNSLGSRLALMGQVGWANFLSVFQWDRNFHQRSRGSFVAALRNEQALVWWY